MGKLAVYKYVAMMFLVLQLIVSVFTIVAIFTILGIFGGNFNPEKSHAMAMLTYALPILIIANIVILAFWLLRRRLHWAVMPAFALLFCLRYVGTIAQPGFFSQRENIISGVKIATYNVERFKHETSGFRSENILSAMKNQDVHIFCIQEYSDRSGDRLNSEHYATVFPHHVFGHDDMAIFSKYPIRRHGTIDFGHTNNSAMWADIDIDGTVVRVFNVHMQTTGINRTQHKAARMREKGYDLADNFIMRALYANFTDGIIVRAHQADQVAREVEKSDYPVILCGDFNDVPYSYTYNTLLGDLRDGFRECGEGFMYTKRGRKMFRIDYIFHDKAFRGNVYYRYDLSFSDHYPVLMRLMLK